MTPQELLQDLRDIHLPPDPPGFSGQELAHWPFAVLTIVLALWLAVVLWRRTAWRRRARARLAALTGRGDTVQDWNALVDLAAEVARRSRRGAALPDLVHRDPRAIGAGERDDLRRWIAAALRPGMLVR